MITEQRFRIRGKTNRTCFREMGKVSLPDASGARTISFTAPLQSRQTPAHATTAPRPGHRASTASTFASTTRRSSGGTCAQELSRIAASSGSTRWTRPVLCGRDRDRIRPRREIAPISPFISWIMLLKGIAFRVLLTRTQNQSPKNSPTMQFPSPIPQNITRFRMEQE